jgi:hypothetical protein
MAISKSSYLVPTRLEVDVFPDVAQVTSVQKYIQSILEILKKYESIKFEAFFHIVGNCEDVSFSLFNSFSQKNNEFAKEYSFLKIVFAKWRKLTPQKITA